MTLKSSVVVMMMVCAGLAYTAAAAELKVGAVNWQKVLEQSPQAETVRKRLDAEFAPRDKAMKEMQKEILRNEERLGKDAAIMSESERLKLDRDLTTQKRDFKRKLDESREDLNARRNEEIAKLQKHVADIILAMAKAGGYDLILIEGVLYASDKVDITEAVLQRLTAAEKEAAPAKTGGAKSGAN